MKITKLFSEKYVLYYRNEILFRNIIHRYASTGINKFSNCIPTSEIKIDIEKYWKEKVNLHKYDETDNTRKKCYILSMFPYPSGALHMGHVRVYTISDTVSRFYRMQGYNVLHPMGWDAFGLPAENAAMDKQIHPVTWTQENINNMRAQLNSLNYAFDWDREFATCDPEYYKWTQALFLKLFERGLVYRKEAFVNWDPIDETVLAEEQVDENNCSWRSGAKVEKRLLNQWFIRTTAFAKSLFEGLNNPILKEWADVIKMQQHWIGECNGSSFELQVIGNIPHYPKAINVWTNYPEFIEYAKFIAVSPNSLLNRPEYCKDVAEGIKVIDAKVLNPFNENELPIFVTDKVQFQNFRDTYIGIPSASMDDFQFSDIVGIEFTRHSIRSYEEQQSKLLEVLSKAKKWKIGGYPVSSRLQDWLISRQRYWGTPIPIIHCSNCGAQPVPHDQLPVILPNISFSSSNKKSTLCEAKDWLNTSCPKCGGKAVRESDTMDTFVDSSWYYLRYVDPKNTKEMFAVDKVKEIFPVNLYIGGKEHAVLHLYYARFISHFLHSEGLLPCTEPFKQLLVQGMVFGKTYQVQSTGKYLKSDEVEEKAGQCIEKSTKEPVIITWGKMSKSRYNGVEPLEVVNEYGIDTTRLIILADQAPTSVKYWNHKTVPGILNWQDRLWKTVNKFVAYRNSTTLEEFQAEPTHPKFAEEDAYLFDSRNYFLKNVTFNITGSQQLSVAISRMQGLTNSLRKVSIQCMQKSREYERALAVQIIMLAPFAPHFASELWAAFSSVKHHLISENEVKLDKDVMEQSWPEIDNNYKLVLEIMINGARYKKIKIPKYEMDKLTLAEALDLIENEPDVQKRLKNHKIVDSKLLSREGCDSKLDISIKKCIETVVT
ncbi:putative leucine--tRNA ligase, mitochondrial [Habropoda laboriosa]|uniref:leucine--tRNA ligase n=1 Tax=Habropoda laboriosa TaxID=597456 RepID=A0A0L7RCS9_9HYME|nr:PREDICTED: probable leucine--tRNA ligase, mitochondrial [Habropoda laboriosa]KOC68609.1 putative leucine--tRNA ligase, mitochondrial [Habropoda laboriosa]